MEHDTVQSTNNHTTQMNEHPEELIQSLERLFTTHLNSVFNVAHRVLWNRTDAEDVVQDTFVKAATRLDQLRDQRRARPWLLQIAYRESIAVLRRRREIPIDPATLPDSPVPDRGPADLAIMADLAVIVADALRRMEPDERLAVVLRDIEELSMREVADVIGMGLSAAKMRVSRGRATLRSLLDKELADAM